MVAEEALRTVVTADDVVHRLRAVFDKLAAHGKVLIGVDQPNTIGALPVTVTRTCGHQSFQRNSAATKSDR